MKIFGIMMILIAGSNFLLGNSEMSLTLQNVHKACENNIPTACFELGELYKEGMGVESNLTRAESYYSKACDGGFDKGCFELEKLKDNNTNEK